MKKTPALVLFSLTLGWYFVTMGLALSNLDSEGYASFSLFYTEEELSKQEAQAQDEQSLSCAHRIHLKALFYESPQVWTLWINNLKITPTESPSLYRVLNITAEEVTLEWWFDGRFHRVQLRPNQSYDGLNGDISEGP